MIKPPKLVALQAVVTISSSFIIYKVAIDKLGVALFGLWVLIFSYSQLLRTFEFGLSNFTLATFSKNAESKYGKLVAALMISIGIQSILFLILFALLTNGFIDTLFPKITEVSVVKLGVGSLIYVSISIVSAINLAAIDGDNDYGLRSLIVILSWFLSLPILIFAIDQYAVYGLMLAYLFQALFVFFFSSFLLVRNFLSIDSNKALNISIDDFNEMLFYGCKYQIGSVSVIAIDPIVKYSLELISDVTMVSIYEISNKLVTGLRSVYVSVCQLNIRKFSINPDAATTHLSIENDKNSFYLLGFIALLNCLSPIACYILFHDVNQLFLYSVGMLTLVWTFDLFSLHYYNFNIASFRPGVNSIVHLFHLFVLILSVSLLGNYFGYTGILAGLAIASLASTLYLFFMACKTNIVKISIYKIKKTIYVIAFGIASLFYTKFFIGIAPAFSIEAYFIYLMPIIIVYLVLVKLRG